jgi:exopolysaccharide production protein ExoQ
VRELTASVVESSEPATTSSSTSRRDLWLGLAALTLGLALLDSLGSYQEILVIKPTRYSIVLGVLLALTLALTPRGHFRQVRFPKALIAFVAVMLASYLWSSYRAGFFKGTNRDFINLAAVVICGQLLTVDRYFKVLRRVGYLSIGLIFVALAVYPSRAYVHAEGLRGGFIHKSPMGAALVMLVALVLCTEPRPGVRRAVTLGVVVLLLAGRTTTGVAAILLVLSLYVPLKNYQRIKATLGRAFGSLMVGAAVIFAAGYFVLSNALISLYGKDLTFSNRTKIWQGVTTVVSHRPLLGYGWSVWSALWLPPASTIIQKAGFVIAESHNTALELLLRLGIVGLVLYLLLVFSTLRTGLQLTRSGDPAGMFAVLLVAMVFIYGFSESLLLNGAWIGILAVAAVPRPLSAVTEVTAPPAARRRLFAPRPAHAV